MSTKITILDGPCSHDLWTVGIHAYDKTDDLKHVHFSVKRPGDGFEVTIRVRITSVQHEDSSGRSFNIEGFVSDKCHIASLRGKRFTGYYTSGLHRSGIITVED